MFKITPNPPETDPIPYDAALEPRNIKEATERAINFYLNPSAQKTSIPTRKTGKIYHLSSFPPPPDADLEHRADDQPATVARRLDAYEAQTAALLPYYEAKGVLKRVDGVGKPEEITARISDALHGLKT